MVRAGPPALSKHLFFNKIERISLLMRLHVITLILAALTSATVLAAPSDARTKTRSADPAGDFPSISKDQSRLRRSAGPS